MGGSVRDLPIGSDRWKYFFFGSIPLVMTFLVFFPVLRYGFVWDDSIYLQVQLPAYQTFWDAFFLGSQVQFEVYYRPLIVASYLFDQDLWGGQSFWVPFNRSFVTSGLYPDGFFTGWPSPQGAG